MSGCNNSPCAVNVRRVLRIFELLAGRFFEGMPLKDLAKALNTSAANACRDMQGLEAEGWARKLDNGNWALTPKPLSIMQSYLQHYEALHGRMVEVQNNITAGARRIN